MGASITPSHPATHTHTHKHTHTHFQVLDEHQEHTLETALELSDLDESGDLDVAELQRLILSATDIEMTQDEILALIDKSKKNGKGDKAKSTKSLMKSEVKNLLASGKLSTLEEGRYTVAVSLAEAETLRRIIHVRAAAGRCVFVRGAVGAWV